MTGPRPEVEKNNFEFMGWKFWSTPHPREGYIVRSFHRLHNPESENLIYSYKLDKTRERAAAWLISHWFEHLLDICPCQSLDKDGDNNFRRAFIETVLS
jgi:hypothetical protein